MNFKIRRHACMAALLATVAGCASPTPAPTSLVSSPDATTTAVPTAPAMPMVAAPAGRLRPDNHHALTPETAPGTRIITTAELRDLTQSATPPVLIDVLRGRHTTVPGAVWLEGAGMGSSFNDRIQRRLVAAATRLTGGDKSRTVVVFCLSEMCWLSYNASVRLAHAGFTDVRWYREGNEGWKAAGLPTRPVTHARW